MINGSGTREGEGRMKEKHTGIEIDAKGLAVQIQGSKHPIEGNKSNGLPRSST